MSSSPPQSSQLQQKTSRRVPTWVPLAAFAGTTIALALPLVYLARSRKTVLRKALNESIAAPPKRSVVAVASGSSQLRRGHTTTTTINNAGAVESSTAESSTNSSTASPGTGELLSAISNVDFSTAKFAGKAFAIATGIVTVGGVVLAVGVKSIMGVNDTKEFAARMRAVIREGLPGLTSQIHRPPETAEEGVDFVEPPEVVLENWKWEKAEKRLQVAYREGGFPAWLHTASRELEAELQVERAERERRRGRQLQEGGENVEQEDYPTKSYS